MTRKSRYHVAGAFYHLMLRGNDGQKIFYDNIDRIRICFLLQQGVERYGHRIHAFCLMDNHVHLLIQVSNIPISKIVQNVAFRYSQYVNRRYKKVGHLFQGRFRAILLDENNYFLRLVRYIHLNPVRAKVAIAPENYKWSSHNAYLGREEITWLTLNHTFIKFDHILDNARRLYDHYIRKEESQDSLEELRGNFKDGQVLGGDDFLECMREVLENQIDQQAPSLPIIIDAACEIFGLEKVILQSSSQSRNVSLARGAIVLHAQAQGISLEEIARHFKRDGSTLSSLLKRFLKKYHNCDHLRQQVAKLKAKTKQLADFQA